jgi:N-acetylglucosaminyl-diphospho-decaprenol L-rhamnosyltransferase
VAVTLPTDVVVPVHNRWELTESCLAHLRSQSIPHRVIVVDNASTDETRERIASYFPEASIVAFELNRGFSVACNSGVEAGDGEIVVLLNNDVECRPDFLERLIAPLAENDGVGMVAALLVRPGEETIDSFGLTVDRTLAGFPRLRGVGAGDAQADTPLLVGPAGAGGAYRRRAWEAVGGLDEGVFAYGEDVDLALRLGAAGWSAAAAPPTRLRSTSARRAPSLGPPGSGTRGDSHGATSCGGMAFSGVAQPYGPW